MLPFWLQTVRRHLDQNGEPKIYVAWEDQNIVGIVPMALNNQAAQMLGPHHVCDYQDMVAAPGYDTSIAAALLNHLKKQGIERVSFRTLRPDGRIYKALEQLSEEKKLTLQWEPDEVTFEIDLPQDWDGYLMQLNGKQRHEVRRKIRRLETGGPYGYRMASLDQDLDRDAGIFLDLFRKNRQDKAEFMDDVMEDYFKDLIKALADLGILRLGILEVNNKPSASVLCFDYQGTRYLYNSGYDQTYDDLSVGILSKVFSIQDAIDKGMRCFDFLKGEEIYKGRIGGRQQPLFQCTLELSEQAV